MIMIKKLLLFLVSISIFVSCVSEPDLNKTGDLIITINYKGKKDLKNINLKLYDFEKGVDSKAIFEYDGKPPFPHLLNASKIKYGEYIAVIYGTTDLNSEFDENIDPFVISKKIILEEKELSLVYTIVAEDECNPNNCKNDSTCVKEDETNYHCECLDGFQGKNCEEQITIDLSCLGKSCSNGCNCDADYCIPRFSSHAGAEKEGICTLKDCLANPSICPQGYECILSHQGDANSFCSKISNDGIGEITFNVTYTGNKTVPFPVNTLRILCSIFLHILLLAIKQRITVLV